MRSESTLIERYVEVFFDKMSEEKYAIAEEKYANATKEITPSCFKEENRQWVFNLHEGTNGLPELVDPHLSVTNNYWECQMSPGNDPAWRVRLERRRFVLNFRKHLLKDPGTKEEFYAFILNNLKMLRQFFDIKVWIKFRLTYFFRLDSQHIDETSLARPEWLEVKDLLLPFSSMPTSAGFQQYVHPCNINLQWTQTNNGHECLSGLMVNSNIKQPNNSLDAQLFSESPKMCKEKLDDETLLSNLKGAVRTSYMNVMTEKMLSSLGGDWQ